MDTRSAFPQDRLPHGTRDYENTLQRWILAVVSMSMMAQTSSRHCICLSVIDYNNGHRLALESWKGSGTGGSLASGMLELAPV